MAYVARSRLSKVRQLFRRERAHGPGGASEDQVPGGNVRAGRHERAGGHETIVVRNSTNQDLPGPGAGTWEEIEALIRDRVDRWRATP